MEILPRRHYLDNKWLREADEKLYDFITDLIREDATTPHVVLKGETLHTCDLEISDCYMDDAGNLFTPTEYHLTVNGGFRDDSGAFINEDELTPDGYEIFKTPEQLKVEFEEWKKDHS